MKPSKVGTPPSEGFKVVCARARSKKSCVANDCTESRFPGTARVSYSISAIGFARSQLDPSNARVQVTAPGTDYATFAAPMNLTFLGAAGTVTGSRYLLETGGSKVLVDCGLFQGLKQLRLRNWAPLPFSPADIEAVVLTHAHLDHSGYLPLLVKSGFRGPVYCTAATAELCGILLPDSGHLQEQEADRANRYGYSKHTPALPLYTRADAERCLAQLEPVDLERETPIGHEFRFSLQRSGHILGSAIVRLTAGETSVVFSGDLGRPNDPIMLPPALVTAADYVVVESTYGDRKHSGADPQAALGDLIKRTAKRGGVVVIPAFAVGRAQAILYHLHVLRAKRAIPDIPVFIDSPMAADVTRMFREWTSEHRLSETECAKVCGSATITNSVEDSKAIDRRSGPMIIISASGMATGGRVLFHLERFAPDARNTILFVGFQAAGTRGATLLAGADSVKIHGAQVPVRAEVLALHGLSAHADADEIIAWLRGFARPPQRAFITHGEPSAADRLRFRIEGELHWPCHIPEHGETQTLALRASSSTKGNDR